MRKMVYLQPSLAFDEHIRFSGAPEPPAKPASARNRGRSTLQTNARRFENPSRIRPLSVEAEPAELIRWLFQQRGLDATRYRTEPLHRRLPACLRAIHASSPEHARKLIEKNSQLLDAALSALLLGVTDFFRDAGVFTLLGRLIPTLTAHGHGLRIWSAGCSQGHELYSMAILLDQAGVLEESYLLGTDCRSDCIAFAEQGRYDTAAVQAMNPHLSKKYFAHLGKQVRINQRIRLCTHWRTEDLLTQTRPGPWDVILWRNCAIYLRASSANAVWDKLVEQLAPGGLLVAGRAERPGNAPLLSRLSGCIYRKIEDTTDE